MAQKKNTKAGNGLKPFYWVLGLLLIVGVAAIAWIVTKGKSSRAAVEPVTVEGADNPQALVAKAQGVSLGSQTAPVKMLVFSDYQCPFCASFAGQIEPLLTSEFVENGTLQFVYYDYPLGGSHRHSFLAARAARCAGDQNKFWEYHNLILGQQSDWSFDTNPPVRKLVDYGSQIGLDKDAFAACVNSDKYQDVVSANHMLGNQLGVNATPTVFVNSKRLPSDMTGDIKALRELINAEASSRGVPTPTTSSN